MDTDASELYTEKIHAERFEMGKMSEETLLLILECLIDRRDFWTKVLSEASAEVNHTKSTAAKFQINKIDQALREIDNL